MCTVDHSTCGSSEMSCKHACAAVDSALAPQVHRFLHTTERFKTVCYVAALSGASIDCWAGVLIRPCLDVSIKNIYTCMVTITVEPSGKAHRHAEDSLCRTLLLSSGTHWPDCNCHCNGYCLLGRQVLPLSTLAPATRYRKRPA